VANDSTEVIKRFPAKALAIINFRKQPTAQGFTPPQPLPRLPLLCTALLMSKVVSAAPLVCEPDAPLVLRIAKQVPQRQAQRGSLVLRADAAQAKFGESLDAQGRVELRHGETRLRAPALRYFEATDEVRTDGQVQIEHLGNRLEGRALRLQLDAFVGELLEPRYHLALTGGSGRAARMDFLGNDRLKAEHASYTSCDSEEGQRPDWELRADKLDLDLANNEGRAKGGVLRFLGVPVLAAPSLTFPLTSERKSGWLPPHVGADNRSGIEFAVPYYWNIAPNADATVTPFVMTRRGFGSDAEVRGLMPWGQATLGASLLPHDRVAGQTRWIWQFKGDAAVWADARFQGQAEAASDDDIWKDLRRRIESPTPRLLGRDFRLDQNFSGMGLGGVAYARAQGWQVLQTTDSSTRIEAPYQRLPQIGLRLQRERHGLEGSLTLEYNRFTLPTGALASQTQGGERLHALGSLAYPLSGPAYWITPRLGFNAAEYRTDSAMSTGLRRARRSLPTVSVDAGLVFERDTKLFRRPLLQTLEPRLLYARTPWRDQNALPNYDSAPLDFNAESLYATSAYSGIDRVSDTNQVSLGATSRWLNPGDGEEQLRLGLVQRYQFRPQRISPDAQTQNRRFSDLLLSGAAHLARPWWLDGAIQYNPDTERTVRSVLRARYSPGQYRTVSLAYRLQRTQSEQLDFAWQWPLTGQRGSANCGGRWYSAGRMQYSLRERRVTDSLVGVEYDTGCWVLRMGVERLSTGLAEANTRFLVQLELVGLSRFGSNALKVLRDNVPGYRPVAGDSSDSFSKLP
jgi:LPS-assembly protein